MPFTGTLRPERTVLSYQEKNELAAKIRMGDGSYETGSFSRLRTAMDYWCSLWFWPIEEADSFPTRAEYIADMMLILSSEFIGVESAPTRQITLDLDGSRLAEDAKGNLVESELDANPRIRISRQVSDRLRFFHCRCALPTFCTRRRTGASLALTSRWAIRRGVFPHGTQEQ